MVAPAIIWGALIIGGGGVAISSYSFGKTLGEGFNKAMPYAVGAVAVYAAYQVTKK